MLASILGTIPRMVKIGSILSSSFLDVDVFGQRPFESAGTPEKGPINLVIRLGAALFIYNQYIYKIDTYTYSFSLQT